MRAPEKIAEEDFESNPFKLVVAATKRFYRSNKIWALVILALGALSVINNRNNSTTENIKSTFSNVPTIDSTNLVAMIVFIVSLLLILGIIAVIVGTYVQGVLTHVALKSEEGKSVTLSEACNAVNQKFWHLVSAQLLAAAKILGWTTLFVIPGVIAALRYSLLSYVVMDDSFKEEGAKAAHDRVKAVSKGRLWEVAGVSMTAIVPVAGNLFDIAGKAAQYKQLKQYQDGEKAMPKIHWLNYLFPLLLALALLTAVSFIVTILRAKA